MNRTHHFIPSNLPSRTPNGPRTIACLLASALIWSFVATATAAPPPASATPPAEVATVIDRFAGSWSAQEILGQLRGKPIKSRSQVQCDKIVGGWGLRCRVEVDTGSHHEELIQMIGWDKPTAQFHLFSVSDSGDSHDHHGTFDGTTLNFEYESTRDGKPFVEHVSLGMKGSKELLWKDVCTVGGEVVFSGEGIYRK